MSLRITIPLVIAFFCCFGQSFGSTKRPNVLLIVADDLGYSDLGCFGGEIQTPSLDRLAERGVRLTQFYSMARCCPSRASILTGQYPHRVGLGHMTQDIGRSGYRGQVDSNAPTIADVLRGAGYRCFLSGKWHLGTEDPTQHGFEQFYGTLVSAKTFWQRDHFIQIPDTELPSDFGGEPFYGTDALTERALDYLARARETPDRPWFIYLAYNAPHFPLHARSSDVAKYRDVYKVGWDKIRERRLRRMKTLGLIDSKVALSARSPWWNYGETKTGMNPSWETLPQARRDDLSRRMAIYAAMVDRMDQGIGRITDALAKQSELDHTVIIFLSDNGACAEWDPLGFDIRSSNQNILHRAEKIETMGGPGTFHSVGSGWANASNTPFRLYKHFCHEGGILSPLILHWPNGLQCEPGSIDRSPTHLIDLLPTLISLSSATYPDQHNGGKTDALPGIDLIETVNSTDKSDTGRTLFFEHEGNRGVRQMRWKLVAFRDLPWELYDLQSDPIESTNLASSEPDVVERLSKLWGRWAEANGVTPLPKDYQVQYLKPRE